MIPLSKNAVISLLTVFILGLAIGILVDRFVFVKAPKPPKHRDPGQFLFEKFSNELDLTEEQKVQLKRLLDEIKIKYETLHKTRREQYQKISDEFDTEFKKYLTPEQIVKFDAMVKEMKEQRKKNHKKSDEDHK